MDESELRSRRRFAGTSASLIEAVRQAVRDEAVR